MSCASQIIATAKDKWYSLALLPAIVVVHNTAHNAVFWRWNSLRMYEEPTLPDLFIYPQEPFQSSTLAIADTFRLLSFFVVFGLGMFTVFARRNGEQIVLATHRYLLVYSAASVLRCVTFFLTMLPATAPYCLSPDLGGTYSPERAPKTIQEVFLRFDWTHGCGDLLFSGHVVLTMCAHMLNEEMAVPCIKLVSRVALPFFLYFTVRSRKHYSIDVIVAVYVTFLLWQAIHPVRHAQIKRQIALKVAKEAKDNSSPPSSSPEPEESSPRLRPSRKHTMQQPAHVFMDGVEKLV